MFWVIYSIKKMSILSNCPPSHSPRQADKQTQGRAETDPDPLSTGANSKGRERLKHRRAAMTDVAKDVDMKDASAPAAGGDNAADKKKVKKALPPPKFDIKKWNAVSLL